MARLGSLNGHDFIIDRRRLNFSYRGRTDTSGMMHIARGAEVRSVGSRVTRRTDTRTRNHTHFLYETWDKNKPLEENNDAWTGVV